MRAINQHRLMQIAYPLYWIYPVVCLENEHNEISTLKLINAVTG